jgi:environmental stress-induced protein Ves
VITLLTAADYKRTPWKNGAGTTTTIAEQDGVWQFGRTPITQSGPFSDYSGYDRMQVLVQGAGLVLKTPDGEIDVRQLRKPVRFTGETKIVSHLEAGPVEVVNLIGRRDAVAIDLVVRRAGDSASPGKGAHFVYCPEGAASVEVDGARHELAADHCLRLEVERPTMLAVKNGTILLGSVLCVSR